MQYVILSKENVLKAFPLDTKIKKLIKKGLPILATCDSKEKAQGFIMGLRAHYVVEKYAGHLSTEIKIAFKSEIAQISTDMYNQIIK